MRTLNVGVLAHVDAGKTSLTERLLFTAGVVDSLGSVDTGTAQTDSMELERRRGITIRTAVSSFTVKDTVINLVDTPGHPDFIAEVERALAVLDVAVLVISAVEGVQPQTVVLWRALTRLRVPTVVFLNKIDRKGADLESALRTFRRRLSDSTVLLSSVDREGSRDATAAARDLTDDEVLARLAERDDGLLELWAGDLPVPRAPIQKALRSQIAERLITPVLAGSAVTGAGAQDLLHIIASLRPPAAADDGPPSGTVFKVDRDAHGRHVFVRMWSGRLHVRDRVRAEGRAPERVTHLSICTDGALSPADSVGAGQIAVVDGLAAARIGDPIGCPTAARHVQLPPPSEESVIHTDASHRGALFAALTELADEDPLIGLRRAPDTADITVSLYGEVQKEVLSSLLLDRYGVPVTFAETRTVCIERVVGTGESVERIQERDNPYLATVGLRVEPAPAGHGIEFRLDVEAGSMPPAFFTATEDTITATLRRGLHGWAVPDAVVTMTESGYWARQGHAHQKFNKAFSTVAGDFRCLTPVVLMAALQRAGTRVCSPVHRFELDVPTDDAPQVLAVLGRHDGVPLVMTSQSGYTRLEGHLPAESVRPVARRLPDLTHGEGALSTRLDHYRPVTGRPPVGDLPSPNPRDRGTWFRDVAR